MHGQKQKQTKKSLQTKAGMETQGAQGEVVVQYEFPENKGITFHTGNVLPLVTGLQQPDKSCTVS